MIDFTEDGDLEGLAPEPTIVSAETLVADADTPCSGCDQDCIRAGEQYRRVVWHDHFDRPVTECFCLHGCPLPPPPPMVEFDPGTGDLPF